MIINFVIKTDKGYINVITEYLPIENIDRACFTASTYIDPSDSLFGACHVLRIVGKKAIKSMSVASITDHNTLLTKSHGRIEMIANTRQILSKLVISFVP